MTYQPFHSEQSIDFYSLNVVSVLPNNTASCMTSSSTKELITPFENSKSAFRSKRRLYETPGLVESSSLELDLFFDIQEHSTTEIMKETMDQYMSKTCGNYGSGEVILFYNGLDFPTRQILDSKGAIPTKTVADAKIAIQEMAEYSQKWHNKTSSKARSTETSEGLAAIQAQFNNLGREIKKVNEKVYAAQVGCEICKGPQYKKDCPLKEEGNTLEEAYYIQFGAPYQPAGQYRAAGPGFYQRNNGNSSYPDRRETLEESLTKFMTGSAKRHEENSNIIKEIRASTDAAIRNQGASIKTLEIKFSHIVLGIVPVAIIDRQFLFEYTITSRSTDVVVMALPDQNINHSAFSLYPAAPAVDSQAQVLSQWNAVYDAYNEVACLIFGSMTPELHRQFENSSPYDMIKELKSIAIVGLILNGLTKDFTGFVRNYNMHNMGKTIGELHAMLIEYEKGLPKKAETPQVMMIKGGKLQKANKKWLKAKGKGGGSLEKELSCLSCWVVEEKEASWLCQFFREARKLKEGALYLYVGNGVRAQVEAIESYDLVLPNGLCFTDFGILFSKNNMFYFNAIPSNGIYEIDMHDLVQNVNSIYNVSTKIAKHNLDSTYLWHCRLAHISKKRIEKLQQEGLLKSTDDESFDQCVSCLSGKMTRKSFPHRPERATDILRIIHTDVCGPLRHVSRQGASYFITFTDDYSRYSYVYLLKHKHEFTPPYTPQHNRVSKRRNRTLLDMVRSMMNLTTLPLSFWDYALESETCIVNMVPTKKVDKTPYELWYGKVPNLSYLKVWGCEALVKRDTPDKLQQRSVSVIL
ncbi:retrotransposon protein, putative, ty1-copia subclass [Tanacetum coccineum]|uniref:Retrotransposon protein, putative, ty1-copia subclass n=1 Tax=Tanacetum coccineum TaxID=301880 RepID=A0ABQ4Z7D5_9ASTR